MGRKERTESIDPLMKEYFAKGCEWFVKKLHHSSELPSHTQNPAFTYPVGHSRLYTLQLGKDKTEYLNCTPSWHDLQYLIIKANINAPPDKYFKSYLGQEIFIPTKNDTTYTFLTAPDKTEKVTVSPGSLIRVQTQIPHQRNGQGEGWLIVYDHFKAPRRLYQKWDHKNHFPAARVSNDEEITNGRYFWIASGIMHMINGRMYQLGITPTQLCKMTQMSKSALHNYCTAQKTGPKPKSIEDIFQALDIFELPKMPDTPYCIEELTSQNKQALQFDVQVMQIKKDAEYTHKTNAVRESWIANTGSAIFQYKEANKALNKNEVIHFDRPNALTIKSLADCQLIRISYTP